MRFLAATHAIAQEVTRRTPAKCLLVVDKTPLIIDLHLSETMLDSADQILPSTSCQISPVESAGPTDLSAKDDLCATPVQGCTTHVTTPLADIEDSRVHGINEKHLSEIHRATAHQDTVSIIGDTQQRSVAGTIPSQQSTLSIKINANHGPGSIYRRLKGNYRCLSGKRGATRILEGARDPGGLVAEKIKHVEDSPLVLIDDHREAPPITAQRNLTAICGYGDTIQARPVTLAEHDVLSAA
jgi:hypothetical protein